MWRVQTVILYGARSMADSTFIMGKIIEQLEASSLHDAFKKYVFSPLGLQNSYLMETENDYCADMSLKKIISCW